MTKRGSKEKGYSGHGLRKASATIAAESGASKSELNAMFGWSGHQMAQLYTKKGRPQTARRARDGQVDKAPVRGCGERFRTRIFATGKRTRLERAANIVVTTWWEVVTGGQKDQSNQAQKAYLVGPGGLEPPTKRL